MSVKNDISAQYLLLFTAVEIFIYFNISFYFFLGITVSQLTQF